MSTAENGYLRKHGEMGADTRIGSVLGRRFALEAPIGEGGAGTVWRARDLSTNSWVAVKILHRALRSEDVVVERFRAEAEVLARLDHPSIVRILAHELHASTPFIVLELAEGRPLADWLGERSARSQVLDADELAGILGPIASALDHVHAAGVVHRDLKPSNILVLEDDGRFRVKVLDFGVARLLGKSGDQATTQGRIVGSVAYLSPEQVGGSPVEAASDLYALGIIAQELVTLCRVYKLRTDGSPARAYSEPLSNGGVNSSVEIMNRIRRGERPVPSTVNGLLSKETDAILQRALATEVRDRFSSATSFVDELVDSVREATARGFFVEGTTTSKSAPSILNRIERRVEPIEAALVTGERPISSVEPTISRSTWKSLPEVPSLRVPNPAVDYSMGRPAAWRSVLWFSLVANLGLAGAVGWLWQERQSDVATISPTRTPSAAPRPVAAPSAVLDTPDSPPSNSAPESAAPARSRSILSTRRAERVDVRGAAPEETDSAPSIDLEALVRETEGRIKALDDDVRRRDLLRVLRTSALARDRATIERLHRELKP